MSGKQVQPVCIDHTGNVRFLQRMDQQLFRETALSHSAPDADDIRPCKKFIQPLFLIFLVAGYDCFGKQFLKHGPVILRSIDLHQTCAHCIGSSCRQVSRARHAAAARDHQNLPVASLMGVRLPAGKKHRQILPVIRHADRRILFKNICGYADRCSDRLPGILFPRVELASDLYTCHGHGQIRPERDAQHSPGLRTDSGRNVHRCLRTVLFVHPANDLRISSGYLSAQTDSEHSIYYNSIFFFRNFSDNRDPHIFHNLFLYGALFAQGRSPPGEKDLWHPPFLLDQARYGESVPAVVPAAADNQSPGEIHFLLLHVLYNSECRPFHQNKGWNAQCMNRIRIR